jgi:L-fuculose-phosphate aldolase
MTGLAKGLVAAGRDLHAAGLLAGVSGNLSARLGDDALAITPTATHKGHLDEVQIVELPLAAGPEAAAGASSEFPLHREAYRARPEVGAVVHTHAPALIAAAMRGIDVPALLPEVTLATGDFATVPLLESGSDELAAAVGAAVAGGAGVVLLRQHGAVTVGRDIAEAVHRMELAELAAYAVLLAEDGSGAVERERVTVLAKRLSGAVSPG